ncbi:protein Tob1 isoform X2 [Drosophila miranda]|uniref:protein Tob1 isoform X2 n=1 Tax=Drosophila miranda TaxID=7229 RepID=UPI0007E87A4C|nr:protein Tob1 isoform X2 [Drosophila miranda]
MHIEIQVALNFVISYLYNKLPRRRVNIFGEELEKALRDKFQGHWYPEKPFKGSAYRCLKTGDAIDSVLERAARESGVPISDILENLPHELSVWMDPGEVSFRVGEKGAVKILYTENNENHEDSRSADREVNKTFNPEAQCFRPIDVVNTTLTNLSLSPKSLPVPMPQAGSSPQSAASGSPTYKGSPNPNASNGSCGSASASGSSSGSAPAPAPGQTQATTQAPAHGNTSAGGTASAYLQRAPQAPLTFTTATFAQTKFGSTKLKTSSKRANSAYRMSPTEFSNYIKQRAIQQQMHHGHGVVPSQGYAALDPVSPARSISPNPLALGGQMATGAVAGEHFFYPGVVMGLYPQFNGQRNLYEPHFNGDANMAMFAGHPHVNAVGGAKYSTYMEACYFPNGQHLSQQQQQQQLGVQMDNESCSYGLETEQCVIDEVAATVGAATGGVGVGAGDSSPDNSPIATPPVAAMPNQTAAAAAADAAADTAGPDSPGVNQQQQQPAESSSASNLIDGINSFYGSGSSYQQLLVAN